MISKIKRVENKDDSRRRLEQKLQNYRQRRNQLNEQLLRNYNPESFRLLNIIEHHIITCKQRLNNEWIGYHYEPVQLMEV